MAIGFSTITCLPAASAADTCSKCIAVGVETRTAPTAGSPSIPPTSSYARNPPDAARAARAGVASATAAARAPAAPRSQAACSAPIRPKPMMPTPRDTGDAAL